MSTLRFGSAVLYVDDLPAVMEFYRRAFGLEPAVYDEPLGFAPYGAAGELALASHGAGELMMPGAYNQTGRRVSAAEIAFYTDDGAGAYGRAVSAGATAVTPPRVMPWAMTVAYVESVQGKITGFVTPTGAGESA